MSTTALAPSTAILAEPVKAVTITVRNTCECRYCTYCLMNFMGERCVCGSDGIPEVECYGCTEDACEYVGVIASQWFAANPSAHGTYAVRDLGTMLTEGSSLIDLLGASGQWEQRWTIEPWSGGVMSVTLYRDGAVVGEPIRVGV